VRKANGRLQSISVATLFTIELAYSAEAVRLSMVFWAASWFAVMLGGIEISIVKARLNATITSKALVFLLVMFLVALVSIPIFLSP
jgi:hypothetical protein